MQTSHSGSELSSATGAAEQRRSTACREAAPSPEATLAAALRVYRLYLTQPPDEQVEELAEALGVLRQWRSRAQAIARWRGQL